MITKYGYDVVAVVFFIVLVGSLLSWYFVEAKLLKFGIIGVLCIVLLFTLSFFRDPDRSTPAGENLVIAPADGEVVLIKDVQEDEYLRRAAVQVSIFMSPLNVHVNRFPISGTVKYFRHFPGEFLVAFDEKVVASQRANGYRGGKRHDEGSLQADCGFHSPAHRRTDSRR